MGEGNEVGNASLTVEDGQEDDGRRRGGMGQTGVDRHCHCLPASSHGHPDLAYPLAWLASSLHL